MVFIIGTILANRKHHRDSNHPNQNNPNLDGATINVRILPPEKPSGAFGPGDIPPPPSYPPDDARNPNFF
jgi:hypothetical protein